MPTAPMQCGIALQQFHGLLPLGSVEVQCKISTTHRPGSAGVHCRRYLPTAARQCGSALQQLHCQVLPGSMAAYRNRSTAYYP